jgi:hypothetical protein
MQATLVSQPSQGSTVSSVPHDHQMKIKLRLAYGGRFVKVCVWWLGHNKSSGGGGEPLMAPQNSTGAALLLRRSATAHHGPQRA